MAKRYVIIHPDGTRMPIPELQTHIAFLEEGGGAFPAIIRFELRKSKVQPISGSLEEGEVWLTYDPPKKSSRSPTPDR